LSPPPPPMPTPVLFNDSRLDNSNDKLLSLKIILKYSLILLLIKCPNLLLLSPPAVLSVNVDFIDFFNVVLDINDNIMNNDDDDDDENNNKNNNDDDDDDKNNNCFVKLDISRCDNNAMTSNLMDLVVGKLGSASMWLHWSPAPFFHSSTTPRPISEQ
ncbi:hypothetical protein PV325_008777, partial [Microctonus aethiopoides]